MKGNGQSGISVQDFFKIAYYQQSYDLLKYRHSFK